jgi:hypothetical protein
LQYFASEDLLLFVVVSWNTPSSKGSKKFLVETIHGFDDLFKIDLLQMRSFLNLEIIFIIIATRRLKSYFKVETLRAKCSILKLSPIFSFDDRKTKQKMFVFCFFLFYYKMIFAFSFLFCLTTFAMTQHLVLKNIYINHLGMIVCVHNIYSKYQI